jgi:hypothetical protein
VTRHVERRDDVFRQHAPERCADVHALVAVTGTRYWRMSARAFSTAIEFGS